MRSGLMTSKRRSRSRGALVAAVVVIVLGATVPTYAATTSAPVANPHGKFLGVVGSQPRAAGTQSIRRAAQLWPGRAPAPVVR